MVDRENWRYTRSWKCQVSVGELYRLILAKLSDKDIKRALHKYRDLMPRQSDWNRKLTQATNIPELGFRYLYRCGQIDESNHRTMQKMLKYMDRQDVLPYFDTILYNTNYSNCSIDELKRVLLDRVDAFLDYSTALTEEEVHPDQPYEIRQCQPLGNLVMTRSRAKRKATTDQARCVTIAKRARHNSVCCVGSPSGSTQLGDDNSNQTCPSAAVNGASADDVQSLAASYCGQVRSSIMAGALGGPAIHALLSASLISMLAVLRMTLAQALNKNTIAGTAQADNGTLGTSSNNSSGGGSRPPVPQVHCLSPARLLAAMPHLLALARIHLRQGLAFGASVPGAPLVQQPVMISRGIVPQHFVRQPGGGGIWLHGGEPLHPARRIQAQPAPAHQQQHATATALLRQRHAILSSGGVGITATANDSCIFYYCRICLRIRIDMGSPTDMLNMIPVQRPDPFPRQLDMFSQAVSLLRRRSPGEFLCSMRFNQLHHLEAFWSDYTSGFLKQMLMDNLLGPSSRSLVGRYVTEGIPVNLATEVTTRWGNGGSNSAQTPSSPLSSSRLSSKPLPPAEALAEALRSLRSRTNSTVYWSAAAAAATAAVGFPPPGGMEHAVPADAPTVAPLPLPRQAPFPPDFDLHLYVSPREYENGRTLLMRNQRTIPSLCRLVAASDFLPALAAATNATTSQSSPGPSSGRAGGFLPTFLGIR